MDWVFDGIGGEYIDRSLKVLKPGGTIVTLPSGTSEGVAEKARVKGMNGYSFRVKSDGYNMKEIAVMLEKGIIKSYISGTYRLDEIRSAHKQLETGKTRGKLVMLPD
jgi:NADPH:quinone reductase-like Zn-dependent oxidoreductase